MAYSVAADQWLSRLETSLQGLSRSDGEKRPHQIKVMLSEEEQSQADALSTKLEINRAALIRLLIHNAYESIFNEVNEDSDAKEKHVNEGVIDPLKKQDNAEDKSIESQKILELNTTPVQTNNVKPIVLLLEPRSFDEAPRAIQALRERKTVILNLTMMEADQAQRAVDFVAGGTFAVDGHQERVGESIFLFASSCYEVRSEEESGSENILGEKHTSLLPPEIGKSPESQSANSEEDLHDDKENNSNSGSDSDSSIQEDEKKNDHEEKELAQDNISKSSNLLKLVDHVDEFTRINKDFVFASLSNKYKSVFINSSTYEDIKAFNFGRFGNELTGESILNDSRYILLALNYYLEEVGTTFYQEPIEMILAIKDCLPTLPNYIHENLILRGREEEFSEDHAYIIENNFNNWKLENMHEALLMILLIILMNELPVKD